MSIKLEACAFCAGLPVTVEGKKREGIGKEYWVKCAACHQQGPPRGTADSAGAAWNERQTKLKAKQKEG